MDIKISVIIPAYNSEKTIIKCIDSILNQSLKEIEILVINDGSVDNTLKILNNIKDERIKIINKENNGVSEARNDALKIAKGEYILNIDSDDWITSECCKEMYDIAKSQDLDIVVSDFFYEFIDKKVYTKDLNISDEKIITSKEYLNIFLKENFYGFNWNKLIKRKIYVENKIFYNKNISMMEDVLVLVALILNSNKIGKINKAYYHYFQGNNNVTKNLKIKHLESSFLVFEEMKKLFKNDEEILMLMKSRQRCSLFKILMDCENKDKNLYLYFTKKYLELFDEKLKNKVSVSKKLDFILKSIELYKSKNILLFWRKMYHMKKKRWNKNENGDINISLSK